MSVRSGPVGSASGLAGALTVAGGTVFTWFSKVIVAQDASAIALLAVMLGTAFLGLLCAIWVAALTLAKATYRRIKSL